MSGEFHDFFVNILRGWFVVLLTPSNDSFTKGHGSEIDFHHAKCLRTFTSE